MWVPQTVLCFVGCRLELLRYSGWGWAGRQSVADVPVHSGWGCLMIRMDGVVSLAADRCTPCCAHLQVRNVQA
jgi:hypothetical protein